MGLDCAALYRHKEIGFNQSIAQRRILRAPILAKTYQDAQRRKSRRERAWTASRSIIRS